MASLSPIPQDTPELLPQPAHHVLKRLQSPNKSDLLDVVLGDVGVFDLSLAIAGDGHGGHHEAGVAGPVDEFEDGHLGLVFGVSRGLGDASVAAFATEVAISDR